jgi:hypothetical protein
VTPQAPLETRPQGVPLRDSSCRLDHDRDLYVSNERLAERTQQNKRTASMLEATTARNEEGQVFTLAELAANPRPLRRFGGPS